MLNIAEVISPLNLVMSFFSMLADGVVDLAQIVDEVVLHLELGVQRPHAEEIVVDSVRLPSSMRVGDADHLSCHMCFSAPSPLSACVTSANISER